MITFESFIEKKNSIGVVGLGYVGLPLAVQLARLFDVIGYDIKESRIEELRNGLDKTREITSEELTEAGITFTADPEQLSLCKLIIVAVPTPIDEYRIPDLTPVRSSTTSVGKHMVKGTIVVFESTVYPGVTEEVCVPILEKESNLKFGIDFTTGYSPERVNPGDKVHTIDKVIKVVAGSDDETLAFLSKIYGAIVTAGIHQASSIKVAEAAKVIENTQRDLNIALMNELAMIFQKIGIDTQEVIDAAATKWNFLPFKPGLVGGHCIGVDPYYLTFKAESLGYHPEMILAGRRINDGMGKYVAEKAVKMLARSGKPVKNSRAALLGITFKEDVPDLRNTKVVDIISEIEDFGIEVMTHDPMADPVEAEKYYGVKLCKFEDIQDVDVVILAVAHSFYKEMGIEKIAELCSGKQPVIIDVKGGLEHNQALESKISYWRL